MQARVTPGSQSGFLVRATVSGAAATVAAGGDGSTKLTFDGARDHVLHAELGPTDVLRSRFEIQTSRRAVLHVSGVPELGVAYDVTRKQGKHRFYASPIPMDGTARTFRGRPPFDVSIGYRHNTASRFQGRRHSVSIRVFLRDENGLILRGYSKRNPFPIEWTARVGDETHASGTMNAAWRARLPALTREQLPQLRVDVTAPAAGVARKTELVPQASTEVARVGELRVTASPQLAANARAWAAWAGDLVASFKDTHHVRPSRIDVPMWIDTMPGLSGWGGWNGSRSYAQFTDSRLFGWAWPPKSNDGTVSHELTHAFHRRAHDRVFQQMQSRAVNRMRERRSDVHRVPSGNTHRALLDSLPETLPETLPPPDDGPFPAPGAAAMVTTGLGDDPFVVWYLSRTAGRAVSVKRRPNVDTYAHWLVLGGFSDDEARAGVLSFFAKTNLAWLVRLRGGDVSDARAEAARRGLAENTVPKPLIAERRAVAARWKSFDPARTPDLDAALARMAQEVGSWKTRAEIRLAVARHVSAKGDRAATKRHLRDALADAWRTSGAVFEAVLQTASEVLATTPE